MDAPPQKFPSPFSLLLRINALQGWRRLKDAMTQSGLLTVIIVLLLVFYPLIASGMFYAGLRYVSKFPGLGDLLIERLIFLMFAFLFMLLLFSNIVVGYTNMFRNDETRFLRSLPFSADHIFRWKLIETTFVASWAFLVLVAPLLLAFGVFQSQQPGHTVGWMYYLITPVLVMMFIMLPAVAGCWIAVFMARYLDRSLFQATAVLMLIGIVYMVTAYLQPEAATEQALETRVADLTDRMLSKTQFAHFPFLPSYWLSSTLTNWVEGAKSVAGFFGLVLVSNVLFFGFLAFTETGKYFYQSLSSTLSRGSLAGDWSQAVRLAPRLCAQVILLAWFLPYVDFSALKDHWHQKFAPLAEEYAAQKKSAEISSTDLGRWVTNQVAQIEPNLTRGTLHALKPGLRRLYERSGSGEMQQLGPDLEHLVTANLRSSLSGLDLIRHRTVLRGKAEEFAAEPEATLMPDAPAQYVTNLTTVGRLEIDGRSVHFAGQIRAGPARAIHRLYLRRHIDMVEEVDGESVPTGEKIWVTDHGNYLEGHLESGALQTRLRLLNPIPADPIPAGVVGLDAQTFWHSQTNPPGSSAAPEPLRWMLARVVPTVETQGPTDVTRAGLPVLGLLAVPVLAVLAWVFNSRAAHLLAALAILGLFIVLGLQSGQWLGTLDAGGDHDAFGVPGARFIGLGIWITLLFAGGQAVFSFWQEPLSARYEAWYSQRQQREQQKEFHYAPSLVESAVDRLPRFFSTDVIAVMLKDIRVFWRDTAQWGQSLILFAILGVYILYLPFFTEQFAQLDGRFGRSYFFKLVSFMNLAACALNLTTLTTRFVYPQFSLEGKRLWIVGMSPLGLERVVKVKFYLATGISLLVSVPLIWLSSERLNLPDNQILFFCAAISIMTIALNGLAVGMGVMYPNLKEDNPSKIVSGFGGTFCLVISFIYIGISVILLGIGSPYGSPWQVFQSASIGQQLLFMGIFIAFSLAVGFGPLWHALRRARTFEH